LIPLLELSHLSYIVVDRLLLLLLLVRVIVEVVVQVFIDPVNILEFSLPVPVLVKQVVVRFQLLGNLPNKVQILLGLVPRDVEFRVVLVLNFDPEEPLPLHELHHEPEVEAPNPDNNENNQQGDENKRAIHFVVTSIFQFVLFDLLSLVLVIIHKLNLVINQLPCVF